MLSVLLMTLPIFRVKFLSQRLRNMHRLQYCRQRILHEVCIRSDNKSNLYISIFSLRLYSNFDHITDVIVSILISLFQYGFDPGRGYLFGFSFGGQLASAVGRILQPHFTLQNIDSNQRLDICIYI